VSEAAEWFSDQLAGADGEAARAYLVRRGVDARAAERFRLGWAPDAWDGLSRHLIAGGHTTDELVDAGLVTQGRNGPIDRFRGRVIFPILDASSRDVLAFGGRVLPGAELATWRDGTPPKYINSPETPLYKKSRVLYGLSWARTEIQRRGQVLIVEGYMDVIGLHLAGVEHAVATCGTALTSEHFTLLEKHTPRVVLALDADAAGFAAAEKARALAAEAGVRDVLVLGLPEGQDPADLAAQGARAVAAALERSVTAVEFQIAQLLRTADLATPESQIEAYRATFPLLATIGDPALRYRYIRDVVARALHLNADLIERELDAYRRAQSSDTSGGQSLVEPPRPHVHGPGLGAGDPQMLLERLVLQVGLQRPDLLGKDWQELEVEHFRAPLSQQLFTAIEGASAGDLEAILSALPDDAVRTRVRALALDDLTITPTDAAVAMLIARLRAAAVDREIEELRHEQADVDYRNDLGAHLALLTRLRELKAVRDELLDEREA
jgi:DNA primase